MNIGNVMIGFLIFSFVMGGFSSIIVGFNTNYNRTSDVDYSDYDFTSETTNYAGDVSNATSSGDVETGGETFYTTGLISNVINMLNMPNLVSSMLAEVNDDVTIPSFASTSILSFSIVAVVLGVAGVLWRFSFFRQ